MKKKIEIIINGIINTYIDETHAKFQQKSYRHNFRIVWYKISHLRINVNKIFLKTEFQSQSMVDKISQIKKPMAEKESTFERN